MNPPDREAILRANEAALRLAGLLPNPTNTGLGAVFNTGPAKTPDYTASADPGLARVAKQRDMELELMGDPDPTTLELPTETPHLDAIPLAERVKAAVDLTKDVKCVYDE